MKTILPSELIAQYGTYTFKVYLNGDKLYFTSYTKTEAKRKCVAYLSPLGYKIDP
jgi:hypothetical protein